MTMSGGEAKNIKPPGVSYYDVIPIAIFILGTSKKSWHERPNNGAPSRWMYSPRVRIAVLSPRTLRNAVDGNGELKSAA